MSRPDVAVVGAGIAGLVAAQRLAAAGCAVQVFEKSRGPGGRCATRRSEIGAFHHGVAGFAAGTAAFQAALAAWQAHGWASAGAAAQRWAGLPTMNALARQLAEGLVLHTEHTVQPPQRQADGRWRLATTEHGRLPAAFDVLLLAVPAEQARPLCLESALLQAALAGVNGQPCWTLMLGWPPAQDGAPAADLPAPPADAPAATGGVLAEVVDVSGLPGPAWRRWVLHATPAWSAAHLELGADAATAALLQTLPALGVTQAPAHAVAHRWRYAQVVAPAGPACGWDAALRLGSCGDAWGGSAAAGAAGDLPEGVERAWLSGQALAQAVLAGT